MDQFNLNDFRKQIDTMQNMGSMRDVIAKIPGMGSKDLANLGGIDVDEEVKRIKGIIDSMTAAERRDPGLIDKSRRNRISIGSGADAADVAGVLKQFDGMADVVRQMNNLRKFRW
jgi:signal recognition particle subunit SRP54